jgi:hypothetical protein
MLTGPMLTGQIIAAILMASSPQIAAHGGAPAAHPVTPVKPLATSINTAIAATPATVTFTATNPDSAPTDSGSATVTLTWKTAGGATTRTWNVKASAPAAFTSCATVPSSAVTATCTSVTGGTGSTCSAAGALSTAGVQIASGDEATGNASYTVKLTYTLADSWEYIASSSCSLTVTYLLTAN